MLEPTRHRTPPGGELDKHRAMYPDAIVFADPATGEIGKAVHDLRVRIADNGPLTPDDIFDREEAELQDPEVGLGLYLVETLVTDSGGSIWIEDNDPWGAVFVVELPRAGDP